MIKEFRNDITYSPLQQVKRYFFAMRNGVVADVLRKGGSPFHYIFGLTLPQLVEASQMFGKDSELAEKLWNNSTTRESMLLAPMLMPLESFGKDDAERWIGQVPAAEVADILCHRLLRHLSFAAGLAEEFSAAGHSDFERYTAGRLALNLMGNDGFSPEPVLEKLEKDSGPYAGAIARQIRSRLEEL